jgi:two-component system sensor histidine kinase PilS (NtrC family)
VRLLQDSLKLLRKSREHREGHRVTAEFQAPRMVCEVDPNRLKQIFWNLATNALKAMPGGGTLSIRIDWTESGEGVSIVFADDGVGMDERQQRHYFQPFSSSFPHGTGLGTAIVYRLVEEHGGKIHLRSGPGRGTAVRIELPRRQSPTAAGQAERRPRRAAGGEFR